MKRPTYEKAVTQLEEIKDMYYNQKISFNKISLLLKINEKIIRNLFIELGLPKRPREIFKKYSMNEKYFEVIDTPDKAYFLGLLFADGDMSEKRSYTTSLSLVEGDKYILETFKKYLQCTNPIKFCERQKESWQDSYRLRICRKKVYNNLLDLNLSPQKSLTAEFPPDGAIPTNLISHFVRGYFDGDGHIQKTKFSNRGLIDICLSLPFGKKLQEILKNVLNIPSTLKQEKIYHLQIYGRNNVLEFLYWMYKDCNELKLTRKYEKYIKLISYYQY